MPIAGFFLKMSVKKVACGQVITLALMPPASAVLLKLTAVSSLSPS